MRPVSVLIFHRPAPDGAGAFVRALADARSALAAWQREAFLSAGADGVRIVATADELSFGERLSRAIGEPDGGGPGGLVVLGSGSLALASRADLRRFVDAAAAGESSPVLANNAYSADVLALPDASILSGLPSLPADNALPRWLTEVCGVRVVDLRSRWRLGVDLDSPADLAVLDAARALPAPLRSTGAIRAGAPVLDARLAALRDVLNDRRAELLVAGRLSTSTLRFLERATACRIRALVEERGMRAASRLAQATWSGAARPPRSVLGTLLDRDGPAALPEIVGGLADAAVVDSRVLLAHRLGADERTWPGPDDRFASDLLVAPPIADPWLRALTEAAIAAPVPILLGGHTLLNGGLRLLAGRKAQP